MPGGRLEQRVEELRIEAAMQRKPASQCIHEMITFMQENKGKDYLLIGFANKVDNKFLAKSKCAIL